MFAINKLKSIVLNFMAKQKKTWLGKLFDSDDKSVSASTVFLLLTSLTAIILLIVPAIVLLVEVHYNHTIASDIEGLATYIGAVSTIFISGGLLKGWTTYNNWKFKPTSKEEQCDCDTEEDEDKNS